MTAREFRTELATLFAQGLKDGDMMPCWDLAARYWFYLPATDNKKARTDPDVVSIYLTGKRFYDHRND